MSGVQLQNSLDAQFSSVDKPPRTSEPLPGREAPDKKRALRKCGRCRKQKTKCLPVDRSWPGPKCDHCEKTGNVCGPNMSTKEERAAETRSIDATLAPVNPVSQSSLGNRGYLFPPLTTPYEMNGERSTSSSEGTGSAEGSEPRGFNVFHRDLGDDLYEWGRLLDRLLALLKALRTINTTALLDKGNTSGQFTVFRFILGEVVKEIGETIEKHVELAESAYKKEDKFTATSIYQNVVFAVRETAETNPKIRCEALSKAALFFEKIGNGPRLQQVLEMLSPLALANKLKLKFDPVQMQARSYLETAEELSSAVAKQVSKVSNVPMRFSAVHQSLPCGNTQVILATLEGTSNLLAGSQQSTPNGLREYLDHRDIMNRSALFSAVILKDQTLCEALIEWGARVDSRDSDSHTILEVAAGLGLGPIVHLLISHAENRFAFVNAQQVEQTFTALQAAAAHGYHGIVKDLLQYGALAKTQREYDGKTAAQLARENGHSVIADELDEKAQREQREDAWLAMSLETLTPSQTSETHNYTHHSQGSGSGHQGPSGRSAGQDSAYDPRFSFIDSQAWLFPHEPTGSFQAQTYDDETTAMS